MCDPVAYNMQAQMRIGYKKTTQKMNAKKSQRQQEINGKQVVITNAKTLNGLLHMQQVSNVLFLCAFVK